MQREKILKTLEKLIQGTLNNIDDLTKQSGFKVSYNKTQCIICSKKIQRSKPNLIFLNSILKYTYVEF